MKNKKNINQCYLLLGVFVGGLLGFCVGYVFENTLLYLAIGLFFGLIIGIAMSNKEGSKKITVVREEKKPAVKKTTTKKAPAKKSTAKKTTKKTTKK